MTIKARVFGRRNQIRESPAMTRRWGLEGREVIGMKRQGERKRASWIVVVIVVEGGLVVGSEERTFLQKGKKKAYPQERPEDSFFAARPSV